MSAAAGRPGDVEAPTRPLFVRPRGSLTTQAQGAGSQWPGDRPPRPQQVGPPCHLQVSSPQKVLPQTPAPFLRLACSGLDAKRLDHPSATSLRLRCRVTATIKVKERQSKVVRVGGGVRGVCAEPPPEPGLPSISERQRADSPVTVWDPPSPRLCASPRLGTGSSGSLLSWPSLVPPLRAFPGRD